MTLLSLTLILGSYLVGAIPFGLILGWSRGIDIRQHGSRNIGATNAGRVLGRRWGILCLALDILKGLIPTVLSGYLLAANGLNATDLLTWIAVAAAAVLGHTFPVYLGFRGGKGVATTIGVSLGIYPYFTVPMIAALLSYAAARRLSGFVSLGSVVMAIVFPAASAVYLLIAGLSLREYWPLPASAAALGLLILIRHRENIVRLLRGQELRADAAARE